MHQVMHSLTRLSARSLQGNIPRRRVRLEKATAPIGHPGAQEAVGEGQGIGGARAGDVATVGHHVDFDGVVGGLRGVVGSSGTSVAAALGHAAGVIRLGAAFERPLVVG